jgi:alpha-tubulin suppressor-like RCC1 family protein
MGWEIIDRLREKKWFVFLFSILLLLNIGCGKKSSGGEGKSNEGISKVEKCPVWYNDADGDGYTDGTTKVSCSKPSDEYVSSATVGDCNDSYPNINPGKAEMCDGKDNNCNNQIDEGLSLLVFYKDVDGDGYTDGTMQIGCTAPAGYVLSAKSGDCNDNDPNINPGKTELCDGKDNNCNGQTDEGFNVGQSCSVGVGECARTGQYVCKADGSGIECNATPGTPTTKICDGKDNDCDGQIDEDNVCFFFASKVAAGYAHTCAIKQDGSLWCWGDNRYGQVGNGNFIGSITIPVQIMSSGVVSVAAGGWHTCAIKQDGSLWCWGWNSDGRLGDGTNTSRSTPVQIMSSGVSSVALGGQHTCAIKIGGSLWCWGGNFYGQLGDGTKANKNIPVQIIPSGVVAVALGALHTCAIKTDGSLWCWGHNGFGQLGDGTVTDRNTPVQIIPSGVSSVAAGYHYTCAIKTDSSLWCWGVNYGGNIYSGNIPSQLIPSGAVFVEVGYGEEYGVVQDHLCTIKQDGSLWCWGWNYYGQLGDGTNTSRTTPVQIMSSGVSSVSLGGLHTCAVKTDSSLWCWGSNYYGQLGDGTYTNRNTPVRVINPSGSGGGGAPSIRDESSFGNREQKQANIEQKQTIYGCSSANIVFYVLHLIFPAFILFALLKRKFV